MADGEPGWFARWRQESQKHGAVGDELLMFAFTLVPGFPVAAAAHALAPGLAGFWLVTVAFVIGFVTLFVVRLVQSR